MSEIKLEGIVISIPDWVIVAFGIWLLLSILSTGLSIYTKVLEYKLTKTPDASERNDSHHLQS